MDQNHQSFWGISIKELLKRLQATANGLTTDEAKKQLITFDANRLKP